MTMVMVRMAIVNHDFDGDDGDGAVATGKADLNRGGNFFNGTPLTAVRERCHLCLVMVILETTTMVRRMIMMIVISESFSINLRVCYCVIVHEFRSENVNFVISKSNY